MFHVRLLPSDQFDIKAFVFQKLIRNRGGGQAEVTLRSRVQNRTSKNIAPCDVSDELFFFKKPPWRDILSDVWPFTIMCVIEDTLLCYAFHDRGSVEMFM